MSTIYNESELIADQKYTIQDVTQIRDTKRFVGLSVLFKQVSQSTASVRITGNMQSVPVRCLIFVKGFTVTTVKKGLPDAYAVISQNNLGIPVGRTYIGPIRKTATHAFFLIDGKDLSIPLDILTTLVREKEKVSKEVKKAAKSTGVSTDLAGILDNPEARKDLNTIPAFVEKMLPNLNLQDLKDILSKEEAIYADYNGNPHLTLEAADQANAVIRHERLSVKILALVSKKNEEDFKVARNTEILKRSQNK